MSTPHTDMERAVETLRDISSDLCSIKDTLPDEQPTLRDRFAMAALTGLIAKYAGEEGELESIPKSAYQFADNMLTARGGAS